MDHEERIRRFHTSRESLDPETQARLNEADAELADLRERGEVVAESLANRHAEVPLPPRDKRQPPGEPDAQ